MTGSVMIDIYLLCSRTDGPSFPIAARWKPVQLCAVVKSGRTPLEFEALL